MKLDYKAIASLVARAKQNDSQAFTDLYQLSYQKLYYLSYSILKDEYEAQDAVQETFIKIMSSLDTLNDTKLYIAWSNRIAYNICIRMLSKRKDIPVVDEHFDSTPDYSKVSDPLHQVLKGERKQTLATLVEDLPPLLQATITLKYYQDMKISDIAMIMSCPEGTVKSRLNKAKKQLLKSTVKENRSVLLYTPLGYLTIRTALYEAAASLALDSQAALDSLLITLGSANFDTNILWKPFALLSVKPGISKFQQVAAFMGGGTAVGVTGVMIALSTLTPVFVSSSVPDSYRKEAVITVQMKQIPKISQVYAIDPSGTMYDSTRSADGTYKIKALQNGTYTITAVGNNNKTTQLDVVVSCIDNELPAVKEYFRDGDNIVILFSDDKSGVDLSSAYMLTKKGNKLKPTSINKKKNQVVFPFPDESCRLFVSDKVGNVSRNKVDVHP